MGRDIQYLDIDLFRPESLQDPFADYRSIRDAGPVVRLRHPDIYALGRFQDVQTALRAPDQLISGEGVGFSAAFNAPKGLNVLQSDGELHRRMRNAVMKPLTPAALRNGRGTLKDMIVGRVSSLKRRGWFDAMKSLTPFLPVEAVSHLVGLPKEGRERMLDWAAAAFNVIGPDNDPADLQTLADAGKFLASLSEENLREGSWASDLLATVHAGKLTKEEAMAAISAYVIPSLDTTILAKGHLLYNLAQNPDQWAMLRAQPGLIPAAVLEGARHSSIVRWFSRLAVTDYEVEDAVIPAGSRVMILYGCANRDERHYDNPDRFDITRDARDNLAWGTGAHMCAGMNLARLEMEIMLEALVEADVAIEAREPTYNTNAGLYGFTELPLMLR